MARGNGSNGTVPQRQVEATLRVRLDYWTLRRRGVPEDMARDLSRVTARYESAMLGAERTLQQRGTTVQERERARSVLDGARERRKALSGAGPRQKRVVESPKHSGVPAGNREVQDNTLALWTAAQSTRFPRPDALARMSGDIPAVMASIPEDRGPRKRGKRKRGKGRTRQRAVAAATRGVSER